MKEKKKITQEQYDKLWGLWEIACEWENLDPNLQGALYVFSDDNPYKQAYEDYGDELSRIIKEKDADISLELLIATED